MPNLRMLTGLGGPDFSLTRGDEREFDEVEASRLIRAGFAVATDGFEPIALVDDDDDEGEGEGTDEDAVAKEKADADAAAAAEAEAKAKAAAKPAAKPAAGKAKG